MTDAFVAALLVLGAALVAVAALGLVRLPDLFTRMHASTKPATLGVTLLVTALALHFGELGTGIRAGLVVLFFLATAPVAAHRLGQAARRAGHPLWEGTVHDDQARPPRTDGASGLSDP